MCDEMIGYKSITVLSLIQLSSEQIEIKKKKSAQKTCADNHFQTAPSTDIYKTVFFLSYISLIRI